MTPAERLAPILDFRTDEDDPITEDHVHSLLLTHPVKGIVINGDVAYDEIQGFLNFCHPTPVPIALMNHPLVLYYRLRESQPNIREGHVVQPDIVGTLFIFAGPWLIHGSIDAYFLTHLERDVFDDLWALLPAPGNEVQEEYSVGYEERRVLRNLMALEDPANFPGRSMLAYLHEVQDLERRGTAVFFSGVSLAALGILALTGGVTLVGQVLAALGAIVTAVSFLSNWAQARLFRRTRESVRHQLAIKNGAEGIDLDGPPPLLPGTP